MWSQLSLVTDAELGALEPEAIATDAPWGANTWGKARNEAKRDLKIWIERDFSKVGERFIPGIADRVLDRWAAAWAFRLTASAYSDISAAVRDDNEEDLDLAAAFATFGTDRIYLGAPWEFEGVFVKLLDSVNANASVLTAKYWGNNQWTSLTPTDGTAVSGKTCAQSGRVSWLLPADWQTRRLNGTADEYFWVELSVSAALTSGTAATQLLTIRMPDGLKRVACYLALATIFNGLAVQSGEPDSWRVRVSNPQRTGYRDMAEDLYATLREVGGIPLDLNTTQSIDTPEQTVSAPLRLRRG